jgi:hypothetical protein
MPVLWSRITTSWSGGIDFNDKQAAHALWMQHSNGETNAKSIPPSICGIGIIIPATARVLQLLGLPCNSFVDENAVGKTLKVRHEINSDKFQ